MKKFKNKKCIASTVVATCLLAIMLSLQTYISAQAFYDDSNEYWEYNFGGDRNSTLMTGCREKGTDSSVYCNVTHMDESRHGDPLYASIVDGDYHEFKTNFVSRFDHEGEYGILNHANEEKGTCYVRIKFWTEKIHRIITWRAHGEWSPDCGGHYPSSS